MQEEFLDKETRRFIMIDEILQPFIPITEYGRQWIRKLPRLVKNQKDFEENYQRLKRILNLDKSLINQIAQYLSRIPSITEQLSKRPTHVSEFARIKRYLYNYVKLSELAFDSYNFVDLSNLWRIFVSITGETESFNLQSEKMAILRKEHIRISSEISKEREEVKSKIEEMFNAKIALDEFTCDKETGKQLLSQGLVEIVRQSHERYHLKIKQTEKSLELEEKLKEVEEDLAREEERLLKILANAVEANQELLEQSERIVELIDLDLSRYKFSHSFNCSIPELSENISMLKAVFPPILKYCQQNGYEYYPVTFKTNNGITLLYGPNMGGKTSFLRTVGSLVALTHLGYPVPAESFCCPLFEEIRYISKGENLGLSSFAKEIQSFVQVLSSKKRKLVLMDEFGSNTNPVEGEALALAITKVLRDSTDFVLLTSHYPRLIKEAEQIYACGKIKDINADDPHKMVEYTLEYGIRQDIFMGIILARKFGLPEEIVREALKEVGTYE